MSALQKARADALADRLGGHRPSASGWLGAAQAEALARLQAMGLPVRRDEYWRYTDPATLNAADAPEAVAAAGAGAPAPGPAPAPTAGVNARARPGRTGAGNGQKQVAAPTKDRAPSASELPADEVPRALAARHEARSASSR